MIRKPQAIVIAAVVVGALALGGAAVPLTDHPKFCASCHNISPSYESWVESTHKDVTCVDCHVRPGVEGYLHDKVRAGLKDVAIYLFGTPTDADNLHGPGCLGGLHQLPSCDPARVGDCRPRPAPAGQGRRAGHESPKTYGGVYEAREVEGEGCTTCHSRVVHGKPIKGYPIVIPRGHVSEDSKPYYPNHPEGSKLRQAAMADCFRCHDGKSTMRARCSASAARPAIFLIE